MLCYMRNIILITKQQLVVCVFNFHELAWPRVFFFVVCFVSAALRQQMVMFPKRDFSLVHLHLSTVEVDAVIMYSCSESQ